MWNMIISGISFMQRLLKCKDWELKEKYDTIEMDTTIELRVGLQVVVALERKNNNVFVIQNK